ncbi:hypothetical protein CXB51_029787 [Gossypium anomalum]|uniref:Phorbol-ester/DAG-type domain-containing protein n=1 Tax=Gossypium anomalum TaxID=47600 RepID=A0A8J6CQ97_9ROSI|nr:hypothetical protein CXB51_029787 [Gossypium anomalum]
MDIIIPPCNHTSHLSYIYLTKTNENRCKECGGKISGTAFSCLSCKVWKHISCADKLNRDLPLKIIHPLHSQHRLQLQWNYPEEFICDKCSYTSIGYRYRCSSSCDFNLDLTCASSVSGQLPKDQEPLRFKYEKKKKILHYSHNHELSFFKYRKVREEDYDCLWCEKHLLPSEVCYGCRYCKFYLHQVCKDKIPKTLSHYFHPKHPLRLTCKLAFLSDKCNACSKWCRFGIPLYDKVASGKVLSSSPSPMQNKALFVDEMEQDEGTNVIRTLVRPIIHRHQMYEVTEELQGENYCMGCRLVLNGSSYFCKTCPGLYLHEKCAKLSYEIQHPIHSSHPLNLYTSNCNFKLDMKCAASTTHKIGVLEEKKMGRVTELHHFTHPHKLFLVNYNDPVYKTKCSICKLQILSPAYFCPERCCEYKLHESCLRLPQKIQVPFHLNHMLVSRLLPNPTSLQWCYACTLTLTPGEIAYSCEHCDFNLHAICANSLRRPLKCEFHLNGLYYFGRNHKPLFDLKEVINFDCEVCDGSCKGNPFYHCLKCDTNFHLKCVPIPDTVKSKYHIHPLILKDSFIEDDSGKYYCDFCEEERNPNDDIYYCEECNGQTIAHIECMLAEVEDNIKIRKNNHEQRLRKKSFLLQFITECRAPIEEVIQAGVVPRFVELLGSPSDSVRKEAVWALANIADDSLRCRDLVLGHSALLPLLALLNEHAELSMLKIATRTLLVFCKPPFYQAKLVLSTLARLTHSNDEQVLTNACWALSHLFDGTNEKIQAIIEADVCGRLVKLLMHPSPSVITYALLTIGHIVTGDDVQTQTKDCLGFVVKDDLFSHLWANFVTAQCVISHQVLPCLLNLLKNDYEKRIKIAACWTISNITAGNKEQIQAVIEANIISPLVYLLQNVEFDIKKQAVCAISNATSGGTHDQIRFLVSQGCIKPLCDLLNCPDSKVVTVCLKGLENILKVGEVDKNMGTTEGVNLYAQMIDDAKGREKIENLRSHDNTNIYEKAVKVVETYW